MIPSVFAAAGMLFLHVLLSPPPAEQIARAVREVYADERVQREFPEPRVESRPARVEVPDWIGVGARIVFWTVFVLAAAALLAIAVRAIAGRRARDRGLRATPAVPSETRGAAPPPPSLADAERYAAAGRFDEAVHALLLGAVETVACSVAAVPDHWTSREVVAGLALDGPRRGDFARLVDSVEQSRFGRHPVGTEEWTVARSAFLRLHASRAIDAAPESPS
jgi:hypothetical protein